MNRPSPTVLRFEHPQPEPIQWFVARTHGGMATAITRVWAEGDESRCRLCPVGKCRASHGVCLILVHRNVPDEETSLFSTVGLRWPSDLRAEGGAN